MPANDAIHSLLCMKERELLLITALACEATPLIAAWDLKPLRENTLGERFQVFHRGDTFVAISGVGKIRAAIATSALTTELFSRSSQPILANIGIAGSSATDLPLGSLVYVNKIRDCATNSRLYPDVIARHGLPELALETHDLPVTTPHTERVLVDMEGAGFMHAALTLTAPSAVCVLKIISDYCSAARITPQQAEDLVRMNVATITDILNTLRSELPQDLALDDEEQELLRAATTHASLSLTQRIELTRYARALKAHNASCTEALQQLLATPITTKESRNAAFKKTIAALSRSIAL